MPNMVSTLIEKPSASRQCEGAEQGDRHHDGRDDRVADVLQEHVHHDEHQDHRFDQGFHDLLIEIWMNLVESYGTAYFIPCGKYFDSSSCAP
jgi:hypothetical protein